MSRTEAAMRHWVGEVSAAALPFERRWTWLALRRVDDALGRRLFEQRGLFDEACITGTVDDIETHGGAMCRGYAAAVHALEAGQVEDDAYSIGQCSRTGFRIAIGQQTAARDRVREIHGEAVCWVTPDELASIMANVEAFKSIAAVKRLFPCEIIDFHKNEPAKSEVA